VLIESAKLATRYRHIYYEIWLLSKLTLAEKVRIARFDPANPKLAGLTIRMHRRAQGQTLALLLVNIFVFSGQSQEPVTALPASHSTYPSSRTILLAEDPSGHSVCRILADERGAK